MRGWSGVGAAAGCRVRARPSAEPARGTGKSINLSETPGLGHYMGMKTSLKGWGDLREINLGTMSTGGSQAEKQRPGPQAWL